MKTSVNYNPKLDNNLILNDCLLIFSSISNHSVDHCITDPPYNISGYDGKKKIGWLKSNNYWTKKKNFTKIDEKWDSFSNKTYEDFTRAWLKEIFRIVKPNGNIIIFGSHHNIFKIASVLEQEEKKILNFITWYKRNAFPNITHRMLCDSTEFVIWAVNNSQKDAKNWVFNYETLKKLNGVKKCDKCKKTLESDFSYCPFCGNPDLKTLNLQMRNMWDIPGTPTIERKHGKHPTQKPLEIIKRFVLGATKENDIIIDPFAGSGTLPLVAHRYKRRYIAIEKEKEYYKLMIKRLEASEQLEMQDFKVKHI